MTTKAQRNKAWAKGSADCNAGRGKHSPWTADSVLGKEYAEGYKSASCYTYWRDTKKR